MRRLLTASDVLDVIRDLGGPVARKLTLWDDVVHRHFLGEMIPTGFVAGEFVQHLRRVFATRGHLIVRVPTTQASRLNSRGRVIVVPDRVEIFLFGPCVRLTQKAVVMELGRFPEAPFRGAFRSETRYAMPLPAEVEATA